MTAAQFSALHAQELIDAIDAKGKALAAATHRVMELEDRRAIEKSFAIRRLMGTTNPETNRDHSASSAEKIVESDEEYASYRRQQYAAVVAEQEAKAAYTATKLRAELAVGLCVALARNAA